METAAASREDTAGVMAPASAMAFPTKLLLASISLTTRNADSTACTPTSSSDPVRSLRYLDMKGTVAPSSRSLITAPACHSAIPVREATPRTTTSISDISII